MSFSSPYSINAADPPKWRPGEEIAAGAFVGMTLFLFVEVNVLIHRAFKKRKGLYFWSAQVGSLGIFFETLGLILKNFGAPGTDAIWPLYRLFTDGGWATGMTAQSLVLYSRLHLVMQNEKIERYVLCMILSTIFIFIIPTIVVAWPAYNTSNREMSSVWSPRLGIMHRYTAIGYTITELIISGLYIWSLIRLTRLKSNVRWRRVMIDLVYVNVMVIAFDFVALKLVFTNQTSVAFFIQTFSNIFKLRLEFVVLNQLMELATRGMRRGKFKRNRYYLTANPELTPNHGNDSSHETKSSYLGLTTDNDLAKDPAQTPSRPSPDFISIPKSTYQSRPTNRSGSDVQIFWPESEPRSNSFNHTSIADQKSFSSDGNLLTQTAKSGIGFKPSHAPLALGQVHHSHRENSGDNENGEEVEEEEEEEEEGEDIDLYLWERDGAAVKQVPWFRSKIEV